MDIDLRGEWEMVCLCVYMCRYLCVCDSSVTIVLIGGKRMNLMEKRSITITISCSLDKMSQDGEKKNKTKPKHLN